MRRVDGVLVYLNGAELWRSNMPTGKVSATSAASKYMDSNVQMNYYPCTTCGDESKSFLKVYYLDSLLVLV